MQTPCFLQVEGLWQPCVECLLAPFCQQHLLPSCLSHILVTLTIFQTINICYGDLWSVIFDIFIIIVLGFLEPCSYKTQRLIKECCVYSKCSTAELFPHLSLTFGSPCSLEKNTQIKPINDPRRPTVQLKGKIIHLLYYIKS